MKNSESFQVEAFKPFSKSLIWQLSRSYYEKEGLAAWQSGEVPHNMTSSSLVGKTYAELIFAFLRDLAAKGQNKEKVYLLELGAGHGRLAFHILKHLEKLNMEEGLDLPPYCYVLSDIVKKNLDFFSVHPQLQPYYEKGMLDLTYYDALESSELSLWYSGESIQANGLKQPLLVLANYFFDSLPTDLFQFKNEKVSTVSVKLESSEDPVLTDLPPLLSELKLSYQSTPVKAPFYQNTVFNELIKEYRKLVFDTYLLFPQKGLQCIQQLSQFSEKGMLLISMDKGFHEIHDLENGKAPKMITHGSMSFSVNYHAMAAYCQKKGGEALFPAFSTFHLELGCMFFLPESESYTETRRTYQRVVDDYGPDDFNGLKKYIYEHLEEMSLPNLLGILRLSAYDSGFFLRLLPQLKRLSAQVTFNERTRLSESLHQTWDIYFRRIDNYDLAFEMGAIFFTLGYYVDALQYFQHSIDLFGYTPDVYFNQALCYYQLRDDMLFLETVKNAKNAFPAYENFGRLDTLNLKAK